MIFNSLEFEPAVRRSKVSAAVEPKFRRRINHVLDSFSLRIPRKSRTKSFHKLNVCAYETAPGGKPFSAVEGIACVDLVVPDIAKLCRAAPATAVKRVKELLRTGIRIAAKNEPMFARHMKTWKQLLATTGEEFDHDFKLTASHRSRRWKCKAVLRITPTKYHYDLLVKDSRTGQTIQRHTIKTTECEFLFYEGIGFTKLRWDGSKIVGLSRDKKEAFRIETKLQAS